MMLLLRAPKEGTALEVGHSDLSPRGTFGQSPQLGAGPEWRLPGVHLRSVRDEHVRNQVPEKLLAWQPESAMEHYANTASCLRLLDT
ncbi:hypothetical protein BRAO285_2000002 [Bradyrhizobium sp. ORS 285]|nr:hypothetical protein BRAO285_2000002 [Bradyrhizobium sp. ORS 285]